MSGLPEGNRRTAPEPGPAGPKEPSPDARPPSPRAPLSGPADRAPGLGDRNNLQRVGTDRPRPVERRSVGTRSVQGSGDAGTAAEEEAPRPYPVGSPSGSSGTAPSGPAAEPPPAETDQEPTPRPMSHSATGLSSTGITGLDAQYGGGLPNGSLFLLTSDPTTATSVFTAQYAAAGLSAGEPVYYFSLEQPASAVRAAVATFVKDPKDLEGLRIIDGYPNQFANVPEEARKRLNLGKGENPMATLEALLVDMRLKAPVRIIIESVTELLAQHDQDRVFRALRVLRGIAQALPATAVVTMVAPLHDEKTVNQAKHIADGVVEFHVERKGFGIYPYIAITKMRGVTGSARLLLFKETETGLWLESTKRVF